MLQCFAVILFKVGSEKWFCCPWKKKTQNKIMIIRARVITDIWGSRSISWDFVLSVGSMGGLLFFVMLIHCGWKREYGQSILLVKYRLLANDLTWEASDA